MTRSVSLVLVAALVGACGGGGSSGDPDAALPLDAADAAGTTSTPIGAVQVIEDRYVNPEGEPASYTSARLAVELRSGPAPGWFVERMRAGGCVLRVHELAECTPACSDGLCVDGTCQRWPTYRAAGRLTLTGLRTAVQIDPTDNLYYPTGTLPADLFADDATVEARFAGGTLPAMTLATRAVAPLTAAIERKLVIPYPAPADVVVRWTPAPGDARVQLVLNANNRGHGLPPAAVLACEAADAAGQLTIPRAMVDAFPDTRAWTICAGTDCPPSTLRRYRRGTTLVAGDQEVELIVASQLTFGVEHIVER